MATNASFTLGLHSGLKSIPKFFSFYGTLDAHAGLGLGPSVAVPSFLSCTGCFSNVLEILVHDDNIFKAPLPTFFLDINLCALVLIVWKTDFALLTDNNALTPHVESAFGSLASIGAQISNSAALTTKLPLLDRSLNGLIRSPTPMKFGDFLNYTYPVNKLLGQPTATLRGLITAVENQFETYATNLLSSTDTNPNAIKPFRSVVKRLLA